VEETGDGAPIEAEWLKEKTSLEAEIEKRRTEVITLYQVMGTRRNAD
jgi:hypothetical protein